MKTLGYGSAHLLPSVFSLPQFDGRTAYILALLCCNSQVVQADLHVQRRLQETFFRHDSVQIVCLVSNAKMSSLQKLGGGDEVEDAVAPGGKERPAG